MLRALHPILLGPIILLYMGLWFFLSMTRAADVPKSPKFIHLRGNYSAGYLFDVKVWIEPHDDIRVIRLDVWDAKPAPNPFADISPESGDLPFYEMGKLGFGGSERQVTDLTRNDKLWYFKVLIRDPGPYFLVAKIATRSWRPIKETRRLIHVT